MKFIDFKEELSSEAVTLFEVGINFDCLIDWLESLATNVKFIVGHGE